MFEHASDRITLLHASVEELPEDEPYDLIISGLPLNNFAVESVEQILAKLRRLLAPGGTLSFFEYVAVRRVKSLVSRRQSASGCAASSACLASYCASTKSAAIWCWPTCRRPGCIMCDLAARELRS